MSNDDGSDYRIIINYCAGSDAEAWAVGGVVARAMEKEGYDPDVVSPPHRKTTSWVEVQG